MAATKLFDGENNENTEKIEVDREAFVTLAKLACTDVVFNCSSVFQTEGWFSYVDTTSSNACLHLDDLI